jgi:hypothetical protein
MNKFAFTTIVATVSLLAALVGGIVVLRTVAPSIAKAASDIVGIVTIPTATSVWIGKDIDTTLIATNTARMYMEISNISGATSTGSGIYCNVNGKTATPYSGFAMFASSTKTFAVDNLYQGALHCRASDASSTVTLIER